MVNQDEIRFVGVDACPLGWFSVGFTRDGRWVPRAFATFKELLCNYDGAELILVDIPIGLPNGPQERQCDSDARDLLNQNGARRGSTVFRTPTRAAVEYLAQDPRYNDVAEVLQRELADVIRRELVKEVQPATAADFQRRLVKAIQHEFAKAIHHQITGKWLTQQELGIMPKIAQVDACLPHGGDKRIREVHPEICFWALNGGKPITSPKDTPEGRGDRIAALANAKAPAQQIYCDARRAFPILGQVGRDDILDALAAAVTAYRGWPNQFRKLPEHPPMDKRDLRMEMVFWQP